MSLHLRRLKAFIIVIAAIVIWEWQLHLHVRAESDCSANGDIRSASFSQDGKYILSSWDFGTVRLWYTQTLKVAQTFVDSSFANVDVQYYAISPNDNYLLTGLDWHIVAWNAQTGERLYQLDDTSGKYGPLQALTFSPDSKQFMVSSEGGVGLYAVETGVERFEFPVALPELAHAEFSPNGKFILTDGISNSGTASLKRSLIIWDTNTGKKLHELDDSFGQFSPDGKYVLIQTEKGVALWDVNTFTRVRQITSQVDYDLFSFSPDGKFLAGLKTTSSETESSTTVTANNFVTIWNTETSRIAETLDTDPYAMVFLPDNRHVLVANAIDLDTTVFQIWDITNHLKTFEFSDDFVSTPNFSISPDGHYMIQGFTLGKPRLWNIQNGKTLDLSCS